MRMRRGNYDRDQVKRSWVTVVEGLFERRVRPCAPLGLEISLGCRLEGWLAGRYAPEAARRAA